MNPVATIDKLPHEPAEQYIPTEREVLKVLLVASGQDRVMLTAYLTTAARKWKLFRWRWMEDINFETRMVRLGTRKTKDGSFEYEWLPMSDILCKELIMHYHNRAQDIPWVFPNPRTEDRYYTRDKY